MNEDAFEVGKPPKEGPASLDPEMVKRLYAQIEAWDKHFNGNLTYKVPLSKEDSRQVMIFRLDDNTLDQQRNMPLFGVHPDMGPVVFEGKFVGGELSPVIQMAMWADRNGKVSWTDASNRDSFQFLVEKALHVTPIASNEAELYRLATNEDRESWLGAFKVAKELSAKQLKDFGPANKLMTDLSGDIGQPSNQE
jgi:hypothetical protein